MTKKSNPNVHITPRDNGWAVKKEETSRASVVLPTKKEATDHGRKVAQKTGVELVVHNRDGKISSKDSHGHDPRPPKGSRG